MFATSSAANGGYIHAKKRDVQLNFTLLAKLIQNELETFI